MKWLIIVMMLVMSNICHGKKDYVNDGLLYFWDFENQDAFSSDIKSNVTLQTQGKVRWVPPEHSFNKTGAVHLHGDKSEGTMLIVPSYKMDLEIEDWTIDFEFGTGKHPLDHKDRGPGGLVDGNVFQWADIKVTFRKSAINTFQGILIVDYRGRKKFIEGINGNNWYYMAFRSEDDGVSVWLNSYCTNIIRSPRRSFSGQQMAFGGDGFAGRFDDIKLYNKRLMPWEITNNYWGTGYTVDPKNKLSITWAEVKKKVNR